MSNKELKLKGRVQNKHKTEAEWYLDVYKAAGSTELRDDPFIPLDGELIIYDPDSVYTERRIKIGDGVTNVVTLPFYQGNSAELLTTSKEIVGAINEVNNNAIKKDSSGIVNLKGNYPLSLSKGTEESRYNCFVNSPTLTEKNIDLYIQPKSGTIALTDDLSNLATVDKIHYIDTRYSDVTSISLKDEGIYYDIDGQILGAKSGNMADIGFKGIIPIAAGDNVTFEVDEENQVVKINATGGSTDDSVIGTWVFNDIIELPNKNFEVKFSSDGVLYEAMEVVDDQSLYYSISMGDETQEAYSGYGASVEGNGWAYGEQYRIIEILEEPTDPEFAPWFKTGAKKQASGYQTKYDKNLTTDSKYVVDAINELHSLLGNVSTTLNLVNELQKLALGEDNTLPAFE